MSSVSNCAKKARCVSSYPIRNAPNNGKIDIEKTKCEACGESLFGTKRRLFCNNACKFAAHRRRKALAARGVPDSPILHFGSFQSYRTVYAEKVDVIITDPPYGREYERIYEQLATFAMDTLVPGGWLLCMTGWGMDYEARTAFKNAGLEYITVITYLMEGSTMQASKNTSCGQRKWRQQAKPIVWFQKKGSKLNRRRAGTSDLVIATGNLNQSEFHWQQCLDAYKDLVVKFTNQQDVVCDPCMGSGTTLAAALSTGRKRIVGIEKDYEAYLKSEQRINLDAEES